MKTKLEFVCGELSNIDDQLITHHGDGVLDGFTHQPLGLLGLSG